MKIYTRDELFKQYPYHKFSGLRYDLFFNRYTISCFHIGGGQYHYMSNDYIYVIDKNPRFGISDTIFFCARIDDLFYVSDIPYGDCFDYENKDSQLRELVVKLGAVEALRFMEL